MKATKIECLTSYLIGGSVVYQQSIKEHLALLLNSAFAFSWLDDPVRTALFTFSLA